MKNHLSMLGSIGAGARVSLGGIGGSWSGLTRLGECLTVRLVLYHIRPDLYQIKFMFILRRNVTWLSFASDELLPSLSTLAYNISGVPDIWLASHT